MSSSEDHFSTFQTSDTEARAKWTARVMKSEIQTAKMVYAN